MICNEVAIDIYTDRARASARALNGVPDLEPTRRWPVHPHQQEVQDAMEKQRLNHQGHIVVTQAEHEKRAIILAKARVAVERQRPQAEALKP